MIVLMYPRSPGIVYGWGCLIVAATYPAALAAVAYLAHLGFGSFALAGGVFVFLIGHVLGLLLSRGHYRRVDPPAPGQTLN